MALYSRITLKAALRQHEELINAIRGGDRMASRYSRYLGEITKLLSREDKEKFYARIRCVRKREGL